MKITDIYRCDPCSQTITIEREQGESISPPLCPYCACKMRIANLIAGVGPDAPTVTNSKGAKQSDAPARMDLIPPIALIEVGKTLKYGAIKYGENNWRNIELKDHINHAMLHFVAYLAGDRSDDHLCHAAARALFALETIRLHPEEEK